MNKNKKIITWVTINQSWNIIKTQLELPELVATLYRKGIRQDVNYQKYEKLSLAICYIYAFSLYDTNELQEIKIENWKNANKFKEVIKDSKEDTMDLIYSELKNGRPVIVQINTDDNINRFATVVGYKYQIRSKTKINEQDLLILDSYDGKLKNIDGRKIYITNGKELDKYYDGYLMKIIYISE